jgi:hypothetical protein
MMGDAAAARPSPGGPGADFTLPAPRERHDWLRHPAAVRPRRAVAPSFLIAAGLLLCATVLQKLALPGTGNSIAFSTLVLPCAIAWGLARGAMVVDRVRLVLFLVFLAWTALSLTLSDSDKLSATSWLYLLVMQAAFVFRFADGKYEFRRILGFVSGLGVACALVGIAQFFAQFVVGKKAAFFMDHVWPYSARMAGFNNLIPITWDSEILKSNGVFFLEPSFYCQFLAIGLIAELLWRAHWLRLGIIGFGIVLSYSGTGLMTLALVVPFWVMANRRWDLVALGTLGALVLALKGDALNIQAILDRVNEFSQTNSSGFGRFISIWIVIDAFILTDPAAFVFGRGPGSVMENFNFLPHGAFDPTWGKIFYEYGLFGSLLYAAFFTRCFLQGRRGLRVPLAFTYFVLGGYLYNSAVIIQLLVLVSWPVGREEERREAAAPGRARPSPEQAALPGGGAPLIR